MKRMLRISLLALVSLAILKPAMSQIAISVTFAPPALPVYEQPPCPQDGYIWVPGYWAWDDDYQDYYWVPGTWIAAPQTGYLWTPPYWGWENGAYMFHDGYWAPQVGFYGGVDYGHGYYGNGFAGGRWDHDHFYYNRAAMNVNTTVIHNVYVDKTVIVNNNQYVSYNGGQGGIQARPTQQQEAVAHMRHVPPPAPQVQRIQMARSNPQMRASANHGRPAVAATQRPTEFSGRGVVQAKAAGAPWHPPANRAAGKAGNARPETAQPRNQHPNSTEKAPARPQTRETPARPQAQQRPAPESHSPRQAEPKPRPETAPRAPQRTQPQPERQRPTPESRPAPRPESRPAPAQRPAVRPAPRPEARPAPEARPRPQAAPRAEPKAKPEARPRPEAKPKQEEKRPE